MIAKRVLIGAHKAASWAGRYWSKLETWSNAASPDYGGATTVDTIGSPATGNATGRFGDCVYVYEDTDLAWSGKTIRCLGDDDIPDQGTISVWFKYSCSGFSGGSYFVGISESSTVNWSNGNMSDCDPFGVVFAWSEYTDSGWLRIYFGGTLKSSYTHSLGENTWRHLYIVWDRAKGLSGGKSIRVWLDGVERVSTTASLPSATGHEFGFTIYSAPYMGEGYSYIDNIKVWDIAIDDPSDEYNSGDGKEGL